MKKTIILVTTILAGFHSFASDWKKIKSENISPAKIELVSSDITRSKLHCSLGGFNLHEVNTSRGKELIIDAPDMFPVQEKGAPDLSRISTSLIIPSYGKTVINVTGTKFNEYQNISIAPSKGIIYYSRPAEAYVYGDMYTKNDFYPGKLAEGRDPHIMRNVRGQVIDIYPFQYNPVTKTLRVYYDFDIELTTDFAEVGENSLPAGSQSSEAFEGMYEQLYANYAIYHQKNLMNRAPMDNLNGRMLIICYDAFESAMTPFVEWKTLKGIRTELVKVSTIGTTASSIKQYVSNYYTKYPDFTYLVLVGDHQQVPSNILTDPDANPQFGDPQNYGSDAAYIQITGNDIYPEVICGRISASQAAHVTSQVTKFLTYEKTPAQLNVNNFKTGLTMSLKDSPDPSEKDVTRFMRYVKTTLTPLGFTFRQLFEDGSGNGQPTATNISTELNKGVGFVSWICHGEPTRLASFNYSTTNVSNLSNTKMWPMIWNCSCQTGSFTNYTAFSEAWMRAVNASQSNAPVGAIGTAMSTRNMPVGPSEQYANQAAKYLADNTRKNMTYGALTYDAYLELAVKQYKMNIEFKSMNIFGDPSLQVRTDVPKTLTLTHHTTDASGTTSLDVQCPVEGAYVSLTLNGKIIGTGYISNGKVNISFPAVANGDQIMVTGTAFNYAPYFGKDNIGSTSAIAEEQMGINSLIAGPVPAKDVLHVSFGSAVKNNYKVEFQNALGEVVYSEELLNFSGNYQQQLNISNIQSGIYFVVVSCGESRSIRKIIIN